MKKATTEPNTEEKVNSKSVRELDMEYQQFIAAERVKWNAENHIHSNNVWETMYEFEREACRSLVKKWEYHITPISEKWWKDRGYGVIWPEDNKDPMKVYKLD